MKVMGIEQSDDFKDGVDAAERAKAEGHLAPHSLDELDRMNVYRVRFWAGWNSVAGANPVRLDLPSNTAS